jgi:hypothetical protein
MIGPRKAIKCIHPLIYGTFSSITFMEKQMAMMNKQSKAMEKQIYFFD